ncbi:HalOD1 output domain-containing protein [Natronosalvus caseinilyticus]|uniref:HalOD1 output domain-containing protein n=1 Tax=Natronosalvus caseinilyticus TaxID=2953747 RepID=UPI0028A8C059|nr:HalOD1 output domain-containing protein [Natronosalvus caseinilyticus]
MNKIQTEIAEERCVSQAVVEAVAEAEGVRPIELTPPLYEVIDLDALDHIFDDTLTIGKVTFNYNSCKINVFSDEYVAVEKHDG